MRNLTGSALPRARHCAWPYRSDVSYPERPRTKAADDGNEVHSMLEHYLAGEPIPVMGPRAQLIFAQVQAVLPMGPRPEVAFAINVRTGDARIIGERISRDYGKLSEDEIALTVDWYLKGDQFVEVGDLKTGFAAHVAHPRENLQLLAGAYAAAKVAGASIAIVRILIAREDGTVPLFAHLDGAWMESVLAELREIHYRTQLPSPAVAGEHCSFCPALGACPQTSQVAALARTDFEWTTEFVSVENDAKMVLHLPLVEKAFEAVRDALKARARVAPIALPNGKVWRETVSKRKSIDTKAVEADHGLKYSREYEVSSFRQVKP
jgi:hypothetical protein